MTHQQAEMAAIAVAAAAKAEVESAYVLAMKNPRNEDEARSRILAVCKNLKFAETAKYSKPVGNKKIEGPSIRFAEEVLRLWRNVKILQTTIYDDPLKRVVNITAIDLESNLSYGKQIVIEKTVERKNATGRDVIAERLNSYGEKVSIVVATEDEAMVKESALASKIIRNNGLRMIPDHIITEAMEAVEATVKAGVDQDPAAAKRKVLDNFARINVSPMHIEKYLGHALDIISPAEIVELKKIYTTIAEGNSTWAEIMDAKEGKTVKDPETADMGAGEQGPIPEGGRASDFADPSFKPGDPKTHQDVKGGAKK